MQVPVLSLIFMFLSALLAIGTPFFLFIVFYKKYKIPVLPVLAGAVAFVLFALVLEQSVHRYVLTNTPILQKPLLFMLYGTLMAGIFEETARFLSFIILKRKYDGIGLGLSYGIGHGGIEAILLAGMSMINNIILGITINAGSVEKVLADLSDEALVQANAQINALVSTGSSLFLVGGLERVFALGIQMSLSVIVFYAVFRRDKRWLYPAAIVLHAIIDAPAALMQAGLLQSVFLVEALACLGSVLLVILAIITHKKLSSPV
jgi:uncharacterized membrane protein YhfC